MSQYELKTRHFQSKAYKFFASMKINNQGHHDVRETNNDELELLFICANMIVKAETDL